MKLKQLLEAAREIRLNFINFNDRTQDKSFRLTTIQLDKLVDVHSIFEFLAKRVKSFAPVFRAVSNAIKTGQPIQDEELKGTHFAFDISFGELSRGESFFIRDDGAVIVKFRVNGVDQPGVINFDDNFLEFKGFIKQSLENK